MHECISWVFTLFSMLRTFKKKKKKKCIMGGRWNVVAAVSEPNRWFTLKRAEAAAAKHGSHTRKLVWRQKVTRTVQAAACEEKATACRVVLKKRQCKLSPYTWNHIRWYGWPLTPRLQSARFRDEKHLLARTDGRTTPGVARRPYAARSAFLPSPMN